MSFQEIPRFKIILTGNTSVGKSAILQQLIENQFSNTGTTIGVDYGSIEIEIPEKGLVKFQIWDTAGQEMYRSIVQSYFRSTGGIVLVYDTTDINSVEDLEKWQVIIQDKTTPGIPVVLVGNKCDILCKDRYQMIRDRASTFAKKHGYRHLECSAKTGHCIQDIFIALGQEIFNFVDRKTKHGELEECSGIILKDTFPPIHNGVIGRNRASTSGISNCCN